MSGKKAFIILLRIVFVFSSLQFIRDMLFKWDGYSYYMRFTDFLPDVSLIYVFVGVYAVLFSFILWLGIIIFIKIIPKSFKLSFEHVFTWIILCILLLLAKKIIFKGTSLTELFGLSYFLIVMVGSVLVGAIVWILGRYNEKIIYWLNSRITPLVWIFAFLFVLAIPFSFLTVRSYETSPDMSRNIATDDQEKTAAASGENRPNIILVIMDTLTSHDMQLYGYQRATTPFLSRWAKDAIVFNRAYSSSNWTTPSIMSVMTGQRPWTHKVWYRAYFNHVENYEKNLAKILKDNGYDVYSFVQNHYAHPEVLGIDDSFMIKDKSSIFALPPESFGSKIRQYFVNKPVVANWILDINPIIDALVNNFRPPLHSTPVPSELVYNRFLKFMTHNQQSSKNHKRPFFAWLHVYPPHSWYLPPEPFMGSFGDSGKFDTDIKQEKIAIGEYPLERQPQIDILRRRYDEFILYSDKQFESFILRLSETIGMSNTIIILTSDHGESFSHGYQQHDGPHLYESLVHVPLTIKMPGKQKGKRINMPVELTDIAPTILELADIPVPNWMEGRSFYPIIEGATMESRPIYSMQLIKNRSFGHPIEKGTIAVWEENYKLIYYLEGRKTLLFDVQSDPGETRDFSQEKSDIRERLLKLIHDNLNQANARIKQLEENNL